MNFNLLKHIRENDDYTVVWLFNIGIEKFWNGEVFTVKNQNDDIIVNHMEEMNILITQEQDILILRDNPNEDYLNTLKNLGFKIPNIVCPEIKDESKSISEILLEDKALISKIKALINKNDNAVLVPYGVSFLEENIAKQLDINLFGSSHEINKSINNKVFSRNFSLDHSFRVPKGRICKGFSELEKASKEMLEKYETIIIKEPCGASGKGLWVVRSLPKLKSTLLIIKRFFGDNIDNEWLVEEWCNKKSDLNYQIYVGDDGYIEMFSIKEQIVDGTVYVGSRIPPVIPTETIEECKKCAEIIGKELYKYGYRGILGVDSMILSTGELIPIVEINGRFTLSTYISFINFRLNKKTENVFAFYKRITLNDSRDFSEVKKQLKDDGLWYDDKGVFIYTSKTIDSKYLNNYGRLFAICLSNDDDELMNLYNKCNNLIN